MKLIAPHNAKKVLLHTCCAPCAGSLIEQIRASGIDITLYYFNPNIYPSEEYALRKKESEAYAEKLKIPFVEGPYCPEEWQAHIKGYENEPEQGKRCSLCFHMRLGQLAKYAYENGFPVITSSLGISRWKDIARITDCGIQAAALYPDITYWEYNWRKKGGSQRMYDIAKENHFYRQEYCGCSYSLKQANEWRQKNQKEKIPCSRQNSDECCEAEATFNLNRY